MPVEIQKSPNDPKKYRFVYTYKSVDVESIIY